ncbi:MAG: (2Fe-2S)-binding protein [Candidatus Kariarchaeaceae archaeon]
MEVKNLQKITIEINGEGKEFNIDPSMKLVDLLRENGYFGVKIGCRNGDCGACTILLEGKTVKSCILYAAQAHERRVTTIEGLGDPLGAPHIIQQAFAESGAVQCGYCTPGMILSTLELLEKNPDPSDQEIKDALDGILCRCTGYVKIFDAVKLSVERLRGEN